MKYCPNCAKELAENAARCPECGYEFAPSAGASVNQAAPNFNQETDRSHGGFNVLSFFFPLVGLILFLVWKDQYRLRAKGCGKWALIGFITEMILSICYVIMIVIFVSNNTFVIR